MLLSRPKNYELVLQPRADYQSALAALCFAALKNQPTSIIGVERTDVILQFEDFLTSGGIICEWSDTTVTVDPARKKPFEFGQRFADYVSFKFATALASTSAGSSIVLIEDVDETVQMTVLALRRLGAELEFVAGKKSRMHVKQAVGHAIKYHLKRESAKIVPLLVIAMAAIGKKCELFDLFADSRFDDIFQHFLSDFQRKNLLDDEPEDELERRLRKLSPKVGEYRSHVTIDGGVNDVESSIALRPDTELAAYLAAGMNSFAGGKLILKGFVGDDISNTPLGQLRRMGVEFVPYNEGDLRGYLVKKSNIKGRRVAYEQLHDYPDAVGALALAASLGEGTSVIRSSPFNTHREESRRRRLCEIIRTMGAKIAEIDDGLVVEGRKELSADTVNAANDPVCILLATAATLGVVDRIEVDDVSAGITRWGNSYEQLLQLLAPAVTETAS
jgi:5-enolpyruvylshikimate-3-phosphate synthase